MESSKLNTTRACLVVFTAGAFFFYSFIQMTLFSTEAMKGFFMEALAIICVIFLRETFRKEEG